MSNTKRIIKNSAVLYMRMFITIIIGLYSSRLVLRCLGDVDFGIYSVVGGIVLLMGFFNTVMITSSHRFITLEIGQGTPESVSRIFSVSLIVHILIAFFTFILAETVGLFYIYNYLNIPPDRIADAVFVFQFALLVTLFSIISIPYQALLTAYENFSYIAIVNILTSILTLGIALSLSLDHSNKLRFYSLMIFLVSSISSLLYISYCFKKYQFIKISLVRDKLLYKSVLSFSGWVMLGAGASMGRNQGSALIINLFFGPTMNTSFGLANQVNIQIDQFAQNVNRAAIPQITKSFGGGEMSRMTQLVCSSSKYTFFMMYIVALPLLLEMNYVLNLWLHNVPNYTSVFCKLLIINALIESMAAGIPAAIQASGKIKYFQIMSGVLSLLSLPVSCFFFKLGYPPYSIILIYIIASLLIIIATQVMLKKILDFDIKEFICNTYLRCFCVAIFTLPLFAIPIFLEENFWRFMFSCIISVLFVLFVIVWGGGMRTQERIYLKSICIEKLGRIKLFRNFNKFN